MASESYQVEIASSSFKILSMVSFIIFQLNNELKDYTYHVTKLKKSKSLSGLQGQKI
jgi:hypothetical protein